MKKLFVALTILSCALVSCTKKQDAKLPEKVDFKPRTLSVTPGYALPAEAEAVDLGLSVKWANINIGAKTSTDKGTSFAWGEIEGKKDFTWATYEYGQSRELARYNFGIYGPIVDVEPGAKLHKNDDVAYVMWGEGWRMPTADDFKELFTNTTVSYKFYQYKDDKGKNVDCRCIKCTAANGNSIILKNVTFWTSRLASYDPCNAVESIVRFDAAYIDDAGEKYEEKDEFIIIPKKDKESDKDYAKRVSGYLTYSLGSGLNRCLGNYIRPVHE